MKASDVFAKNQIFALIAKGIDGSKIIAINVLVARTLGPEIYGKFSYVIGIISLIAILAEFRIQPVLVKELSSGGEKASHISAALILNTMFSIMGVFLVFLWCYFEDDRLVSFALTLCALGYIFNIPRFFRAVFISEEKNSLIAISESISSILVVILMWIAIGYVDWEYLPFLRTLDLLVVSICFLSIYFLKNKEEALFVFPDKQIIKKLFTLSYPLVLSGVAMLLFQRMDIIMIQNIIGSTQAGYYAAASNYMLLFGLVPMVLAESLGPKLIRQYKNKPIMMERYVVGIMYIGIFLSIVLLFSGIFLIPVMYGESFEMSIPAHLVLSICPFFIAAGAVAGQMIVADGRQSKAFWKSIIACLINFVLNLVLIPQYGISGAAVATAIGFFVANLLGHFLIPEYRYIFNMQIKVLMPWKLIRTV